MTLIDKGFPEPPDDAKEQLAFQTYLRQLEPPQLVFRVKQKSLTMFDTAVTATIAMESYMYLPVQDSVTMC